MRLIARLPDQRQVGALVDTLRNMGIGRNDMIVSDLADDGRNTVGDPSEAGITGITMVNTDRTGLNNTGAFAEQTEELKGDEGIVVAVRAPKHSAVKIREAMEQSGAVEIIQD